ncbi:MAG: hypothetical protein HXY47_05775 [Nitrospirae bacterium]|nr:hypothetical protein [Nitrospirota bacterium]
MAEAMVVTYECNQCGTEVVVTETLETKLSPIYCCGMEITKVSSVPKNIVKPKKKVVKRVVKKGVKGTKKKISKKKPKK